MDGQAIKQKYECKLHKYIYIWYRNNAVPKVDDFSSSSDKFEEGHDDLNLHLLVKDEAKED